MNGLTINPDWDAAELELKLVMANGSRRDLPDPIRFRREDLTAAKAALSKHDFAALDRLAIREYIFLT